jgi:hypothetical protein
VLCVTNGNAFLRAALLDDYFEIVTATPAEYPVSLGAFDVTIFDGVAPAVAPDAGSVLYLHPSGRNSPLDTTAGTLTSDGDYSLGFDTVMSGSPLLHWVEGLDDINIAEAVRVVPRTGDLVIGASARGPLLVSGTRDKRRFVALTFDLLQSDLPMRPAWPILLVNTIGDFVGKDVFSLRAAGASLPSNGGVGQAPAAGSSTASTGATGGPEGPTNRDVLHHAGMVGFAGGAYKRVYADYQTVARQQLERSNPPAAVRYYVERYFEAIRPRE